MGHRGAGRHARADRRALHKAVQEVQDADEVQKQFATEGAEVVRTTPAEFGAFMAKEMTKWERVVKEGGIKAE